MTAVEELHTDSGYVSRTRYVTSAVPPVKPALVEAERRSNDTTAEIGERVNELEYVKGFIAGGKTTSRVSTNTDELMLGTPCKLLYGMMTVAHAVLLNVSVMLFRALSRLTNANGDL
jgi:hypothetical protein